MRRRGNIMYRPGIQHLLQGKGHDIPFWRGKNWCRLKEIGFL